MDIIVANAGVEVVYLPAIDITEEDYDKLFTINTKGAFLTVQGGAKHAGDNGRIIYISSSTITNILEGKALYGSSKLAPMYLVEVLAKEIGQYKQLEEIGMDIQPLHLRIVSAALLSSC
ncbi:short chain dehydrogenase [Salibacterium qingdaonense]|uniref:Short chain dehydrogenase n=2 Tax=Salibacterium qingdaonense TaxID=266892 RepID=A0A1I4LV04_9BACI|nr:short chain dehydrogenase [Salibacterium qingdaonense]